MTINQPVQLDGAKPLWDSMNTYVDFILKNLDEIYDRHLEGDENAETLVATIKASKLIRTPQKDAVLMISLERYIHDYHPEIAVIVGGYPK